MGGDEGGGGVGVYWGGGQGVLLGGGDLGYFWVGFGWDGMVTSYSFDGLRVGGGVAVFW